MNKERAVAGILVMCGSLIHAHIDMTRWIVATTIHEPTPTLKQLVNLEGWQVVVVGDKKTPPDWALEKCIYLSVEQQERLPYAIIPLTPWNHYSRKNIGYLYAIEHGATIIYDTDDDNILLHNAITYLPAHTVMLSCNTQSPVFNVYRHFRQSHVWPRGYPLEFVHAMQPYSLQPSEAHPYIQQMIVDNDPDVDGIFRLTQELPIFFDHSAPSLCLAPTIFCPYNSQSTIYHYQAFWGLVIPISQTFRVSDIWRGYWVQRLLWDIGGVLSFLPPLAWQERNRHNYHADFINELDLYRNAGALVTMLSQWQCTSLDLKERIGELTDAMVAHTFFGEPESAYIRAWLADLERVGYKMPAVAN